MKHNHKAEVVQCDGKFHIAVDCPVCNIYEKTHDHFDTKLEANHKLKNFKRFYNTTVEGYFFN